MSFGKWDVNVAVGKMPQKIATAFAELNNMVGAEYNEIAYLGSQVVNGTNHAVLAEQTIIAGKDTKNIVVVIFHETKEGVTLSGIERVVESGGELGGIQVAASTEIPTQAQDAFNRAFEGFVGMDVKPFAFLGTQVTKGTNYIFVAEAAPVTLNPEKSVLIVTVNTLTNTVAFTDILTSKQSVMSLGYAFTWLTNVNTSVGKPLGEWP